MGSRPVRIGNAAHDPPPARHLRRVDGLGVPVRQVRLSDRVRRVDERRPADRLGVRALAGAGREHLGGARRAPGVPLLAGDVLGGDRPRHPPREQALVPGSAARAGTRHGTPSTATSTSASGTRRAAASSSTRARPRSTPRRCSCRWCASCRRPTRAGSPPCARSSRSW